MSEVASLRAELKEVRDDRDRQLLQVQTLTAEVVNCEELAVKSNELEVCFYFLFSFLLLKRFYALTTISSNKVTFLYR